MSQYLKLEPCTDEIEKNLFDKIVEYKQEGTTKHMKERTTEVQVTKTRDSRIIEKAQAG